jgi:AraC-like DNA-binding protein
VAKHPSNRRALTLSWSDAVVGAELYDGKDVRTFASNWHFHEGWQVVAVSRGERRYEFKSGAVVAKPGRLVLIPPRLVHRGICPESDSTSFKIATLPEDSRDLVMPGTPMVCSNAKPLEVFTSYFESLKSHPNPIPATEDVFELQAIFHESTPVDTGRVSVAPAFVLRLQAHLLAGLDNIPSLDSLSLLAGVSRYHLSHAFTKHIGLSPLAFHARARLMRSRRLIAEGSSLADTSLLLSFSDQSHFGRQFRRVYGMTPGEYQQRLILN